MNWLKNFIGWKPALIIGLTLAGTVLCYPPREKLKLGIDLSGGTILVYEVRTQNLPSNFSIDELIGALKKRVNPNGVLDIPIRKVGGNRIEIILPEADSEVVDEVKRKLTTVGALEFRILASRKNDKTAIDRAMSKEGLSKPPARYLWAKLGGTVSGTNPTFDKSLLTIADASKRLVRDVYSNARIVLTGKDAAGTERTESFEVVGNTSNTFILSAVPKSLISITSYRVDLNPSDIQTPLPGSELPSDHIVREQEIAPGVTERYILVNEDRQNVSGQYLAGVNATQDERLQPAVGFKFDRVGARKFGTLTREHLPQQDSFKFQLAILLDNLVMSAPSINSEIRDSGIIEGGGQGFRQKDVARLTEILNAGSLPASLNPEPLQEDKVGPTLGEDTIAKGVRAIWISMLVVPIFMIVYYRVAGVIAVVALFMNLILLLGSMALFQATFTLPGLAGLALTIGMAVDANVLIFERMREEQERGAGMSQQIRNGFNRAWLPIFDANLATVLSGFVLYYVGTEEVKGFAVTLIIGLVWNLFTAVFVSRVIFEFLYNNGFLKKLKMMKIMERPNIDFIGARKACQLGSLIVILIGLTAVFLRGNGLLNIDFTGGTLVTIRLNGSDPQVQALSPNDRSAFVREKTSVLPDVTVESLNVAGEATGLRFNIRTTEQAEKKVREVVLSQFGPALQRVSTTVGTVTPIPPSDPKASSTLISRFAGGREYPITLNVPQRPSVVAASFVKVLDAATVLNPTTRFEVLDPKSPAGAPTDFEAPNLVIRTDLEPEVAEAQLKALSTALSNDPNLLFERLTNFGGVVAGETKTLAILANLASWVIIAAFLWFRFKSLTYGLAAIVAVIHDVLITLGCVAATFWLSQIPIFGPGLLLAPFKIDLPMVAAFLTLIGFSVNDTIVVFDRIREIKGKTPILTAKMINDAVNETLSRTILTALTAWLVVLILYVFGGEGLHGFAFSLVIGLLSGTYSTVYIASPILIDWAGGPSTEKPKVVQGELAGAR